MRIALHVACVPLALLAGMGAAFSETPAQGNLPAASTASPAPEDWGGALYASSTTLDRIGRVVAPVTINGRGPFRLVVDTGASHSTFSPRLAEQLGLTPSLENALTMNGVTGTAQVPTVTVDRLQAGDVVIQRANVPVVWSSIMSNADGILGVAGLRSERILVDFRNDRIVITRSRALVETEGFLKIPARRVAGGLLQVDAKIGGVSTRVVIDTGAERSLGNLALRNALKRSLHRNNRNSRWSDTQVFGATDQVAQGQSSIAPDIRIGQATISGTEIVYGDFHIFKVWNMDERPSALIGMDVLGTVEALVIDFRERELYLDVTPPRKVARD
jgi:predicted aspartyl protease